MRSMGCLDMLPCHTTLEWCILEGNSLAQVLRRFHELEDSGQKCSALSYAAAERQGNQLSATGNAAYQSVIGRLGSAPGQPIRQARGA